MNEVVTILFENEFVRIEAILSNGVSTPPDFWYDQEEWEWVKVTKGRGIIRFSSSEIELKTGQSLMIKPHELHQVIYTSADCEWFCLFIKA